MAMFKNESSRDSEILTVYYMKIINNLSQRDGNQVSLRHVEESAEILARVLQLRTHLGAPKAFHVSLKKGDDGVVDSTKAVFDFHESVAAQNYPYFSPLNYAIYGYY